MPDDRLRMTAFENRGRATALGWPAVRPLGLVGWAVLGLAIVGLATPSARADVFRLLPDDQQALQARVDLIQQAQYEIDCAYYAADTGRVPAAVLSLLIDAAERGVRVRLLVDGLMSRLPLGLHRTLRAHGVEIHVYRPPDSVCPNSLNRRMHDKLLIVDRTRLVMGSRNLQDAHFGLRTPSFLDCDVFIEGPTAHWAAAYFQWLWSQDHVLPMDAVNGFGRCVVGVLPLVKDDWTEHWKAAQSDDDYCRLMRTALASLVDQSMIRLHSGQHWAAGCNPHIELEFLHESDAAKSQRSVQNRLLQLIGEAHQSLLIQTPYPVFTQPDLQVLFDARRRGLRVVICTNSLHSTDRLMTYSAFENSKQALLIAGVEIYETPGPNHLHSKAVIIDDCISVVGSYNFDERSANLNMEVSVIAYDANTAMQLRRVVESQMTGGRRVTASPPLLEDSAATADKARHWKMQFGRLLVPTFRWLL